VPIPSVAEQKRIVAEVERRLSVISANEKAIAANLSRAERLRQSILQQAFSGQLVPQSRGRGGSRTAPTVTNTGNSA
jgi:type I restriction enzyme S subunit